MALQRDLSLTNLTLAVVTGTIGSGWLFAPYFTAKLAGGGSLLAWCIGGLMAFLLALVFAELGSVVPSSGALAQIPLLSHGRLSGFIGGWAAWLSYVSLPAIELVALLEYLSSSLPWLTIKVNGSEQLTLAGHLVAVLLLLLLCWINLNGVRNLARWIDGLTWWKIFVPLAVAVTLMCLSGHWGNFSIPVAGKHGADVVQAVGSGGILFSLLGFRTAMDLAGEARRPSRDVPLAMGLGLGTCLLIYLVLQLSFLVSVPPDQLSQGWHKLSLTAHGGPIVALAMGMGLSWMVSLLLIDAVISPGATALTYVGVSARISWMMGECGLIPQALGQLNRQGVPHIALILSTLVSILILAIGPGWQSIVSFLTSTLIIALATGPISLLALRRQLPDAPRGYRLPMAKWLCPLSFVVATWAISWCGRNALDGAVLCIGIPTLLFVIHRRWKGIAMDVGSAMWWPLYLGLLVLETELFGSGRPLQLPEMGQLMLLAGIALGVLPLAVNSALPEASSHARIETSPTTNT